MKKLKQFLFKYKHAIIILYLPIYMVWFILLEHRTDVKFSEVHCIIDDFIPFCIYNTISFMVCICSGKPGFPFFPDKIYR